MCGMNFGKNSYHVLVVSSWIVFINSNKPAATYLVFAAAGLKQVYGYEEEHDTKFTEVRINIDRILNQDISE